jgi:hypothetical protein
LYPGPVDRPRLKLRNFSEGGDEMNIVKIMATVLIVAGIVALM